MLGCVSALQEPPSSSAQWLQRIWVQYGQALGASLLVLPLVLLDCLMFSNRLAGPVRRLHVAMKQLADGQAVRPLEFRRGDYYWDLAHEFNRILTCMQANEEASLPRETAFELDCCEKETVDRKSELARLS
jgi:nitrogen fixation/metabolism regulation signal transduction histidine kinase